MDGFRVTDATCLCQKHFKDEDIKRNPRRWKLNPGAVPALFLYSSIGDQASRPARQRKAPIDRSITIPSSVISFSASSTSVANLPTEYEPVAVDQLLLQNAPTTLPSDHGYSHNLLEENALLTVLSERDSLQQKLQKLQTEVHSLNAKLTEVKKRYFSLDNLQKDDSATRFYTGFPNYTSLVAVFNYFKPKLDRMTYWRGSSTSSKSMEIKVLSLKRGPKRRLSHIEEFVFVLMRLKVGLFLNDLADRFGISIGNASKIFTTWINFLYYELPLLFPFPSKEKIQKFMPDEFNRYPSTRIIIDCTEIFTEIPSSMKAQSQTWSDYKHHNTWKVLVGISPNGAVTFVSKLWSGRVSDKQITVKCGVLSLLEPGDNIMADRGFDIADILPHDVSLNIPPFKGKRDQLTPEETEETARIAAVRIHVERAIGRIKNYNILDFCLKVFK